MWKINGGQRLKQNRGHTWIKRLWIEAKRDNDYFTAREEGTCWVSSYAVEESKLKD